jgi:hypothetical protein
VKSELGPFTNQSDVDRVRNLNCSIFRLVFADTIDTLVRVRLLGVNATIVLDVLKCLGWKTSVASKIVVCTGTVNQLLLRKRDVLSSGLSICCLKCSSSAARISIGIKKTNC